MHFCFSFPLKYNKLNKTDENFRLHAHTYAQTHKHTPTDRNMHTYSYANIIIRNVCVQLAPCFCVCVFVSLGSLYRVVCFLLPFCSVLWINFSELNALRKVVASLTYLSHCFSWQFVKKNYQKEIQQIICLIKNAQSMAQFTKLSIRLSLRHCDSINLQLSAARATTLINHRVCSLTLCRSCTSLLFYLSLALSL